MRVGGQCDPDRLDAVGVDGCVQCDPDKVGCGGEYVQCDADRVGCGLGGRNGFIR